MNVIKWLNLHLNPGHLIEPGLLTTLLYCLLLDLCWNIEWALQTQEVLKKTGLSSKTLSTYFSENGFEPQISTSFLILISDLTPNLADFIF